MHILISAGPTREPLDAVRFLSNYSTGYMGAQLAAQALRRGHRVTVVSGPIAEALPRGARVVPVQTAQQMGRALRRYAAGSDVIVMAAAVSDFRPVRRAAGKLSRRGRVAVALRATPDLVASLPRRRGQVVAGFAVERGAVLARARRKLNAKRLDLVVAQRIAPPHGARVASPFGRQRVRAWMLARRGGVRPLGWATKAQVAGRLLDAVEGLWDDQRRLGAHGQPCC
ncbi:MAG: phosphopantothenoylcysteine decarboxylase [Candidatus Omnitrophica bacterium]|nr:phosphopantothenoylcysteine decarboxylase [Candidatus Omnitrophota bacterium]